MMKLSSCPPHFYEDQGMKFVDTAQLTDYYRYDVYKGGIDFTDRTLDFIRNAMNSWPGCPRYVEETDSTMYFEYWEDLVPLSMSTLICHARTAVKRLQWQLYHCIRATQFTYDGTDYFIMPVNNWLQNYMINHRTDEVRMIDVDSFEVVELENIETIFEIVHNNEIIRL